VQQERTMNTADPTRAALEAALAENPDDLATHMAYADHLAEQGDPRGEFIQVQLALEDPTRKAAERKKLQQRERQLLDAHEREWLGELAPLLLGTGEEQRALFAAEMHPQYADRLEYTTQGMHFRHSWARGWLDRFECGTITVEMARKLGRAPVARLLRVLVCQGDEVAAVFRYQPGPDIPTGDPERYFSFRPCEVLANHPVVRNLRVFRYGQEVDPEEDTYQAGTQYDRLAPLVASMPRLEELYIFGHIYMDDEMWQDMHAILSLPTLANLRIYQHYHGTTYALESLVSNPALGQLTHLLIFPHSFSRTFDPAHLGTNDWIEGREGPALHRDNVRAVLTSPHLRSLTHLQLRCCSGGDAMVQDIASSGILNRLEVLDLRHGLITDQGAKSLAQCPETRNLELLDLVNNRLTAAGIAELQSAGIRFRAERQQGEPYRDETVLYLGDSE
jgi:uncharacterized protein (TIGR02996 family)